MYSGAAGTPKSARGCARGAFESPDATPKPPRSQSRTNRSGDNSVSRHGSQREPMSTPEQSPQSFNIRKLSQSEQSPYAPMPSPRSDRQHLNLSSNPSFKERTPGTPPVPPSPHGSLKERRRESSKKEKGCDDQNVYFFTSGLVSDSEADNSNVFGAAGVRCIDSQKLTSFHKRASSKMAFCVHSSVHWVVSVKTES